MWLTLHFLTACGISDRGLIVQDYMGIWGGPPLAPLDLVPLTHTEQRLMCAHLQKHVWRLLGTFQRFTTLAGLFPCFLKGTLRKRCSKYQLVRFPHFLHLFTSLPVYLLDISEVAFNYFQDTLVQGFDLFVFSLTILHLSRCTDHCYCVSSLTSLYLLKITNTASIKTYNLLFAISLPPQNYEYGIHKNLQVSWYIYI